jgi:thiol-disulfide isomerase/thioredoxin
MPYTELAEHEELKECINDNNSVIIYYGATWCRSCVTGAPIFETVSGMEEYQNVKFFKVDTDTIPESKESQEIVSIPLIIGYLKGKEVTRSVGVTVDHLVEIVEECIPPEENPEVPTDE